MTKLTPDGEWAIRQLDEMDEADDLDMAWADRDPYRRRVSWLLSEFRRQQDNVRALALLAGEGLLDRLAWVKPAKRKKADPLDRAAEYVTDDARRILVFYNGPRPKKQFAAEVAVERHSRLPGMILSEEEKHRLEQKVIRRLEKPSGPARAERSRKATSRAK